MKKNQLTEDMTQDREYWTAQGDGQETNHSLFPSIIQGFCLVVA